MSHRLRVIKGPARHREQFNPAAVGVVLACAVSMVGLSILGGFMGSASDAKREPRGSGTRYTPCPDDLKARFAKQMAPEKGEDYVLASHPVTIITKMPDGEACALKLS